MFSSDTAERILSAENMPSHDDIMEFSAKIAPLTGRKILSDSKPSRVALVGQQITPIPIPEPTMFSQMI